jgi:hypothetical protein
MIAITSRVGTPTSTPGITKSENGDWTAEGSPDPGALGGGD